MRGIPLVRREWKVDPIRVTEFWMQVDRGPVDACWPWLGFRDDAGYGLFAIEGRRVGAHELAVSFATGEQRLPDLETCHSCGNPPCCNPKHLRFDTRQSNVDDMVRMGRNHKFSQRLSDEQVRLIRRRREAGANQDHLAEQFGVCASYISQIVTGVKRVEAGGPIADKRARRYIRKQV